MQAAVYIASLRISGRHMQPEAGHFMVKQARFCTYTNMGTHTHTHIYTILAKFIVRKIVSLTHCIWGYFHGLIYNYKHIKFNVYMHVLYMHLFTHIHIHTQYIY